MKWLAALTLASVPISLTAADVPANAFPDEKIGIPPLSLGEAARQGVPPPFSDGSTLSQRTIARQTAVPKQVSNMPILAPRADIDAKLRIVTPSAAIDHKLIVKVPDVESAK